MFDELEKKRKKIATQKKVGEKVIVKKAGRPREPEKKPRHLKIPELLYKQAKQKSSDLGMNLSSFVCLAIKNEINKD